MQLTHFLSGASEVIIKQKKEGIELLGFEGRNRYEILSLEGTLLAQAEEQKQSFFAAMVRQVLRHWRPFTIVVTDEISRQEALRIHHPFRIYFQRLEVTNGEAKEIGSMEKQFSILSKKFQIGTTSSASQMQMKAGLFKIWTYPFLRDGKEVASVQKKWTGTFKDAFTDADTFLLSFKDSSLNVEERQLLLAAALFIDIQYFEDNQGLSLSSFIPN